MRRSTTLRGGIAAGVILVIGLSGLAACSGGGNTPPVPSGSASSTAGSTAAPTADTAADQAALASITITGAAGAKPTIALPSKPFAVTSQVARLVDQGSGDAVAAGNLVTLDVLEVSGADGSERGNTWDGGQPIVTTVDASSFFDQLYQQLVTAHVGTRILLAAPTTDDSGAALTVVDLLEVASTKAIPARAEGTAVAPTAGLPTVTLDATGKPSLTAATGTAPTSLVVQPLIKGAGPAVTAGQTVVVKYTGWLWDGTQFDSSWDSGSTFPVQNIGQAQVIDGWNQGLVGVTVGSQVLLVVPPSLGYKDTAQGSIPANSTLVFVIDVLAAQ
ncbi:MAG TPA: FKBP-type peptidyl-prolyl cis-trans isomerase [Cellulomonas sp.]